ncbi:hypothetical protein ACET3Z_029686 [Daucus carota]
MKSQVYQASQVSTELGNTVQRPTLWNLSVSLCCYNSLSIEAAFRDMPHRTCPMAALLLFTGLNVVLVSTITPVYDFVCFHPYWERRRERRRQEREAASASSAIST